MIASGVDVVWKLNSSCGKLPNHLKNKGNGQAKVLTIIELERLFIELNKNPCHAALFAICLYTGCRISEALHLETSDIKEGIIVFRKSTTKGKLKTRVVPIHPNLEKYLTGYHPGKAGPFFPGQRGRNQFMTRGTADRVLRTACDRAKISGASTHSFRRTALTLMSRAGVPLRHIQEISGHSDLGTLQRYLEVGDDEKIAAIRAMKI